MNEKQQRRNSYEDSSGARLDIMLRRALADRAAYRPSSSTRQLIMARAREETIERNRSLGNRLFGHIPPLTSGAPVTTVMWAYSTGSGAFRRDSNLTHTITQFTSPMLNLMR